MIPKRNYFNVELKMREEIVFIHASGHIEDLPNVRSPISRKKKLRKIMKSTVKVLKDAAIFKIMLCLKVVEIM